MSTGRASPQTRGLVMSVGYFATWSRLPAQPIEPVPAVGASSEDVAPTSMEPTGQTTPSRAEPTNAPGPAEWRR
jgi:hypothetical protein